MRADRLISIVMLLQSRGRITAHTMADELEVSERTIYRDIDALSAAGIPIYGDRGPEGGYSLLDTYRSTLTGLTADELRALLTLSIPAPLDDLGLTSDLKTAMYKLAAALPGEQRANKAPEQQRIYLDSSWWFQSEEATPFLKTIHEAVQSDRKLRIRWRVRYGLPQDIEQTVAPYGLVAKASVWYVVCTLEDRVFAHRVSHLTEVEALDVFFERPADFDLAAFWQRWCAEFESVRPYYGVKARVASHFIADLPHYFGPQVREQIAQATPDDQGRITVELPFESLWSARSRLLALGSAIEVLEPEPLRLSIVDYAQQIIKMYD
ncbi:MAG: YafY family transcriptional regulator [Anaerolineae bacterium]|nr:YafY family transcriptional regulator [Anaerolineae bacterium]